MQPIVDKQLFVRLDIAKRMKEDAVSLLLGLAVGLAAVIDPLRGVTVVCAVDHAPVTEIEEKRVTVLGRRLFIPTLRRPPRNERAPVLEELLAGADAHERKNAATRGQARNEPQCDV